MATAARDLSASGAAQARAASAPSDKSLLRFLTCGSVDDGKSTLIGRLLHDGGLLPDDQLAEARDSSGAVDFASLVDGLAAEREQGITIDVAYRFFATERRKFIVADTPGHEQYTRNMVTGASTADLAVILVDARKGLLRQTRRHSWLVHLLGIGRIVLAVNKMDLVDHDERRFRQIVDQYESFAREAGIGAFTAIPMSGQHGDNVVRRSAAMPWYDGPALLEHLETVEPARRSDLEPFRMAVQWVNRPHQDFRGFSGRIAAGRVRVGDAIVILPSGRRTSVSRIVTFDGDLSEAVAGQSVTLLLADHVDCSRGDLLATADAPPAAGDRIEADLVWMVEEEMVLNRSYRLKIGTRIVAARVTGIGAVIGVDGAAAQATPNLSLNAIARVTLELDRIVPAELYAANRELGGFILIDLLSNETVAAGMVRGIGKAPAKRTDGEAILWLVGGDGAVRGAAAARLAAGIRDGGRTVILLGEAELHAGLNSDVPGDLEEQARRAREVASLIAASGSVAIVALPVVPEQAYPGRVLDAAAELEPDGPDWII